MIVRQIRFHDWQSTEMDLYFSDSVLDQKEKPMLKQGQAVNNRYQIHAALGQGGFGAVYKGWDDNVQRHCVIKENLQVGGV